MDICTAVKIGNGAGNLEDARVGTGGESQFVGDQFQHPVSCSIQLTELFDVAGRHLGVAVDFRSFETLCLNGAGFFYSRRNGGGAFRFATIGQITIFDSGNFDVDVDTIKQWTGNA